MRPPDSGRMADHAPAPKGVSEGVAPGRADRGPDTLAAALLCIARQPIRQLLRRWNWKSAVMSSFARGLVFFAANLSAGPAAAVSAASTELTFRIATSGFY